MSRYITLTLEKHQISCTALLLDDLAPRTCATVWDALPQYGRVLHAKYARNEIFTVVPTFAREEPGRENTTVTPIPGDLCYFLLGSNDLHGPLLGSAPAESATESSDMVDLALFYGRNNLLLNADVGWVPGNVYGSVVEGLDRVAALCEELWSTGVNGEILSYTRA